MSTRLTLTIFKGCTECDLREAVRVRTEELKGRALFDSDDPEGLMLGVRSIGDVHSACLQYTGTYGFFKKIGAALGCPWMEARIQEGALWDYSLMRGADDVHGFSTLPEYFISDPRERERYAPKPDELSSVWGVDQAKIEKYTVWWGQEIVGQEKLPPGEHIININPESRSVEMLDEVTVYRTKLTGKAYLSDEFEYGDCWQLLDFLRALGGDMPPSWHPGEMLGEEPLPGLRHGLFFPDKTDICAAERPARERSVYSHNRPRGLAGWIVDRLRGLPR